MRCDDHVRMLISNMASLNEDRAYNWSTPLTLAGRWAYIRRGLNQRGLQLAVYPRGGGRRGYSQISSCAAVKGRVFEQFSLA